MADLAFGIAGIAGTIDVCIKFGKALVQAYKDYGQIDAIAEELSVRIQICWSRLAGQLEVMSKLLNSMTLDQRELQSRILRILESKLEAAVLSISKPEKYASSRKIKALQFLNLRESFQSTVADLEAWQLRFEPSWFQIIKTSPAVADRVLKDVSREKPRDPDEPTRTGLKFLQSFDNAETVKLAEKVLNNLDKRTIQYSKAEIAIREKENKYFILDTISRDIVSLRDARELASRLRDSSPLTFGTLKCKGIVQSSTEPSLTFVFGVPEGYSTVRSCRELLLSGVIPDSLTKRLKIARQLVSAVYYIHLYEFVHKNIIPETILTLERPGEASDDMTVCLVGFQLFRYVEGPTNTYKADRTDILYQHPSRLGSERVNFVMQHDIYSLGVCLLEIGLWQSLVNYQAGEATLRNCEGHLENLGPDSIKERLISISRTQLRATMGDIYSRVVETCLTCLDEGNEDFGDPKEFEVQNGVEVGSRYVKKVMDAMSMICY
ncbi:het-s domain-containing [Fusarium longipes]|uniref:Het-s domain-containing n=1 Tax=Fusarium longipes TaxID=694270 RepID=A0A395T336_9HYPO|nr:het-s domain-containing [Fusarium longipes]